MNDLKIQTLPQVIHSLTAKCAIPHTQVEHAWVNNSLILAQNFWSNRHWPWCKFLCIHSVVKWLMFSCCSFVSNTIQKLYKKLVILGLTDAGCGVHFCASTHLLFRSCCSSFGNKTSHKMYKISTILGLKMLFLQWTFCMQSVVSGPDSTVGHFVTTQSIHSTILQ